MRAPPNLAPLTLCLVLQCRTMSCCVLSPRPVPPVLQCRTMSYCVLSPWPVPPVPRLWCTVCSGLSGPGRHEHVQGRLLLFVSSSGGGCCCAASNFRPGGLLGWRIAPCCCPLWALAPALGKGPFYMQGPSMCQVKSPWHACLPRTCEFRPQVVTVVRTPLHEPLLLLPVGASCVLGPGRGGRRQAGESAHPNGHSCCTRVLSVPGISVLLDKTGLLGR